MPSTEFFDHLRGLQTKKSPFQYLKNETPDARNIEYDGELGSFSKAPQYTSFANDIGDTIINGIMPLEQPLGGKMLFVITNGVLYRLSGNNFGNAGDSQTFHSTAKVESAILYDRLFFTNGENNLDSTNNGMTFSTVSKTPKYLDVYRNRLYIANLSPTTQNRFEWSNLGDGLTFAAANNSTDIPDQIVGVKTAFNFIHFFTPKSYYRFDEAYLTKVDDIGATSHRSIQLGNGYMFWANYEGVWVTNGASKPQKISRPVQHWWDGIDKANFDDLNGTFFNDEYYLWVGTSQGVTDVVLVYNTLYQNWRILTGWPSSAMAVWTNPAGDKRLYFANNTANSVIYIVGNTMTQNGTLITCRYTYPHATALGQELYGQTLHCFAQSSGTPTFQIQYALDWSDAFTTLYEWTLEGRGFVEYQKIDVPRAVNGRAIQWRIIEQNSADDFTWQGIKFNYEVGSK